MMYQALPFLAFYTDSDTVVSQATDRLESIGMRVVPSFDLKMARAAHALCSCPHHGTSRCDCQLVILLIYDPSGAMATLVAHGRDGETQLSVVDSAEQRANSFLISTITRCLSSWAVGLGAKQISKNE